jgi:hypothetical protein
MFDDKQFAIKSSKSLANPLVLLARNGPIVIRSKIEKENDRSVDGERGATGLAD